MAQKSFAVVELPEGKLPEVAVTLQDKLQYERTARVKRWPSDLNENMFTFAAFVAWHATKRNDLHQLNFDEFSMQAIEATVRHEDNDELADDSDLTQS